MRFGFASAKVTRLTRTVRPCSRCVKRNIGHLCHDEIKEPRSKAIRKESSVTSSPDNQTISESAISPHASNFPANGSNLNGSTLGGSDISVSLLNDLSLLGYDQTSLGFQQTPFSQFASEHTNSEFLVLSDFLNIMGTPSIPGTPLSANVPVPDHKLSTSSTDESGTEGVVNDMTTEAQDSAGSLAQQYLQTNLSTLPPTESAQEKFFLAAADPGPESAEERLKQVINAKVEAGLMKPFNYVRGYARLQKYMDAHMSTDSRQRILKPLSTFRPAFRAIAKRLTDVDLILVEEAFERLLLDYDRVFTSMAIPACLWRRTGEIFRGNKEFAALINIPVEHLRDGKLAITELMAEDSAVNYWEKYGHIAFDGGQKAVLTSCLLQNPKKEGGLVSCCFSFTIKRDRYNM